MSNLLFIGKEDMEESERKSRERERGGYFLPLGRVRENSMKQGEKCRRRGENDNFILQ